jgi:hypothetical protein
MPRKKSNSSPSNPALEAKENEEEKVTQEATEEITSEAPPEQPPEETQEVQTQEETLPEIQEDVTGYLLEECPINGSEESNSKEYISSIVNGFRYNFPVKAGRTFNEGIQLGMNMMTKNLKEGQVLSFNPQRMTPFFFIPECGISLNPDNPTFTFREGELRSDQVSLVIQNIRSGDLVLGDYSMSRQILHTKKAKIDVEAVMSKGEADIRAELKSLMAGQTKVNEDGSIESPGIDVKAMLDYEVGNQNRRKVVEMIKKALHEIGGMVEYIEENVVEEELRRKEKQDREKLSKQYDARSVTSGTSTGFGKGASVGDFL